MMKSLVALLMFVAALPALAAVPCESGFQSGSGIVNAFEHKILKEIFKTSEDKNVFITAPALNNALAMLANGTTGKAQPELLKALGFDSIDQLNKVTSTLLEKMNRNDSGIKITSGSGFWADQDLPVVPSFREKMLKIFKATVANLPLKKDSERAAHEINSWASKLTDGMITAIIDPDTAAETDGVLASGVLFKGGWLYKYDPQFTRNDSFVKEDGTWIAVEFMEQTIPEIEMLPNHDKGYIVARIRYASKDASMYIVFPTADWNGKTKVNAKNALLEALESGDLNRFNTGEGIVKMEDQSVKFPKFKFKYTNKETKPVLQALGVDKIFEPGSLLDLSPDPRLKVSYVRMDTALEVDEEGSAAAGIASMGVALESAMSAPEPFHFTRPFGLVIRDDKDGTHYFSGVVQDPTEKE